MRRTPVARKFSLMSGSQWRGHLGTGECERTFRACYIGLHTHSQREALHWHLCDLCPIPLSKNRLSLTHSAPQSSWGPPRLLHKVMVKNVWKVFSCDLSLDRALPELHHCLVIKSHMNGFSAMSTVCTWFHNCICAFLLRMCHIPHCKAFIWR